MRSYGLRLKTHFAASLQQVLTHSWLRLMLALGDPLVASLYHQLLSSMEKDLKVSISLINTFGKEKCHVHSKIKHKSLLKLFVVLNYVWNCFIYINQVDENGLHAIFLKRLNAFWREDKL